MSTSTSLPMADTSDMACVHRVFREALSSAPKFVATVAPDSIARAELVGSYYDNVLRLLHVHHDSEDALMTPKLIDRLPGQTELIQRIAGQHRTVFGAVEDAENHVARWRADPSDTNRDSAAHALATLDVVLTSHLDEEEAEIVPLAASCMNVAEWGELPEHGMQAFTGDKPWLVLGLVQEQMPAAMVAQVQAHLPPPVLEFWTTTGRALFDEYVLELRG